MRQDHVTQQLFGLPFFSDKYPHGIKMMRGIIHHLEYVEMKAEQLQLNGQLADTTLPLNIAHFKKNSLCRRRKHANKGKLMRKQVRLSKDNDTLERLPEDSAEIKAKITEAMAMLEVLLAYLEQDDADFNWNWRKLANTLMVGIIFFSTLAGTQLRQLWIGAMI